MASYRGSFPGRTRWWVCGKPDDAVPMSKKKDDEEKVPDHVRKAQKEFLRREKEREEKGEKPEGKVPYAIDWKTGKPLDGPKP